MNILTLVLVNPIINALLLIYHSLILLHIPYALGFSVIILTALIRLALSPLLGPQIKMTKKMQKITPQLNKLKEIHKNDQMALQKAQMALYKEHGINPAAGCLSGIIQLPVMLILYYQVFQQIFKPDPKTVLHYINQAVYAKWLMLPRLWDTNFFGIPLGQSPSHVFQTFFSAHAHLNPALLLAIVCIPLITAGIQFVQSKMIFSSTEEKIAQVDKEAKQTKNKALVQEVKKEDDFATAFQKQSLFMFPLIFGFLSWSFPVGLSLYYTTLTFFGILHQYRIAGLGGLSEWIKKQ